MDPYPYNLRRTRARTVGVVKAAIERAKKKVECDIIDEPELKLETKEIPSRKKSTPKGELPIPPCDCQRCLNGLP